MGRPKAFHHLVILAILSLLPVSTSGELCKAAGSLAPTWPPTMPKPFLPR